MVKNKMNARKEKRTYRSIVNGRLGEKKDNQTKNTTKYKDRQDSIKVFL